MSTELLQHVRSQLERASLFHLDHLLIVAVSGGPDSLCLLHLLVTLRAQGGPRIHVAHLDHTFRGEQSAAEARFVAEMAVLWGVDVTVEQAHDLPARVREHHLNLQAAARATRYSFFARLARVHDAVAVVTAHHANDQAETLLMHLVRGTGNAGLRGMLPSTPWETWAPTDLIHEYTKAPPLIRPLLAISRPTIEAYCTAQHLSPRYDPSNHSPTALRTRIRAELVPLLARYNPRIVETLGRTAQLATDDYDFIQQHLAHIIPSLVHEDQGVYTMPRGAWLTLHPALQRSLVRFIVARLVGNDECSFEHVEAARQAIAHGSPTALTLSRGIELRIYGERVTLSFGVPLPSTPSLPQLASESVALANPGTTPIGNGWYATLSATTDRHVASHWEQVIDADSINDPLVFRCRRAGDRFRPAGGRGSRRLQDFFVDQKLPRELRDAWPLLATVHSILWVAGLRADARFVATEESSHLLRVTLHQDTVQ